MVKRPALPVSLYVAGRRAAVIGDGPGADDRASRLARAGADVARIAEGDLETAGDEHGDSRLARAGVVIIHPAGPPDARHERLAASLRSRGALVYVHDRPDVSDFAMPALVRKGSLQIAVSTDGGAPALSRRVREELGRVLDTAGAALSALLSRLERLRAELPRERRGELYAEARRLRFEGRVVIDGEEDDK